MIDFLSNKTTAKTERKSLEKGLDKNSREFMNGQDIVPAEEKKNIFDYCLNQDPKPLSSEKYDPVYDAKFKYQAPVPFRLLAEAFEEVANSKGKNSKNIQKEVMSNLFRSIIILRPDHLVKCFYLCIGRLCPEHKGIELGVGNEMLYKIIGKSVGLTAKQVKQQENNIGDLGMVAGNGKMSQKNLTSYFSKKVRIFDPTMKFIPQK